MEKHSSPSTKLSLVQALNSGYKFKFSLKNGVILIENYSNQNKPMGARSVEPNVVDNKLTDFGEWIQWDKLNTGHSYWLVKNNSMSVTIFAKFKDTVVSKELIAISIIKSYERKYLG